VASKDGNATALQTSPNDAAAAESARIHHKIAGYSLSIVAPVFLFLMFATAPRAARHQKAVSPVDKFRKYLGLWGGGIWFYGGLVAGILGLTFYLGNEYKKALGVNAAQVCSCFLNQLRIFANTIH